MARHEGREAATPVVMGEQLDPPKYGESWSEAASRVFFASYREYEQRVKIANAEGVVRRQLMGVSQLIPVYVQRCFAQHVHGSRIPRFRVSPNVYRCWIAVAHVFEFWRRCAADSAREWASQRLHVVR